MNENKFWRIGDEDEFVSVDAMDVDGVGCLVRTILTDYRGTNDFGAIFDSVSVSMVWVPGVEVKSIGEDGEHILVPIKR